MKKLLIVVLALSVVIAFTGMAFAKTPKVVHKDFRGSVVSTDQTANTIVVAGWKKGQQETFSVDPAAKLLLNKKVAKLADYVAGTKVHVKYTVVDGKNVAHEIR